MAMLLSKTAQRCMVKLAIVRDHAEVFGNARIIGEAIVSDEAVIYNSATIMGSAIVSDKARVFCY